MLTSLVLKVVRFFNTVLENAFMILHLSIFGSLALIYIVFSMLQQT